MSASDWASLGITEADLTKQLTKAKINLVGKKSGVFLATIMTQTKFLWDWTIQPATAQTNGEWVKIHPRFFAGLPRPSQITLIAHELLHIAYGHMTRMGKREAKRWNVAGDHVINLVLLNDGYSFVGLERGYKDRQYEGMSTERVYDLLPASAGQPQPNGGDAPLSGDVVPLTSKLAKQQVMTKVVRAHTQAAMNKQAGDIPGEVELVLEKFLNPIIPWEIVLEDFFIEATKADYSFRRPNRRFEDILLPSLMSDDGLTSLNFYQDASASVDDADILRMFSEVAHIKERYDPEVMRLAAFDTEIRTIKEFHQGERFHKIEITGRGGTDLAPVRADILKTMPKGAVIFSDFECDPMDRVPVPVLWVRVGDYGHVPDWGRVIQIDNEDMFD